MHQLASVKALTYAWYANAADISSARDVHPAVSAATLGRFGDTQMIAELRLHITALKLCTPHRVSQLAWSQFCRFANIKDLNIGLESRTRNVQYALPEEISRLSNLETLYLHDYHPMIFPRHLSSLQGLSAFKCASVTFAGPVQALGSMTTLAHMHCERLAFVDELVAAQLSGALASLTSLTSLHLDLSVHTAECTIGMQHLNCLLMLVELSISNTRLTRTDLPAQWPRLRTLLLRNNHLEEVPDISYLSSLQTCRFADQAGLQIRQPLSFLRTLPALSTFHISLGLYRSWSAESMLHLRRAEAMYRRSAFGRDYFMVALP